MAQVTTIMRPGVDGNVMRGAIVNAGWLTLAMAGLVVLLIGPAYSMAGSAGLQGLAIATAICLVPGWVMFVMLAQFDSEQAGAYVALGSSGLRMALVLIAVFVLRTVRPEWGMKEFFAWVICCYLVSLAVETWLVMGQRSSTNNE